MDQSVTDNLPPEVAEMLPDEVIQYMELQKAKKLEKIVALGQAVAKKRDDAVKARAGLGIEDEWAEAEDQYQGIDAANRDEAKVYKPLSPDGGFIQQQKDKQARSTVFLNITRPYTDAAVARISDMLLPTDDRNWAIKPTPVPEIDKLLSSQVSQPAAVSPTAPTPPGTPAAPDPMAQAVAQAMAIMDRAKESADQAQSQIDDWLVQCQYHGEVRKMLEDCGRLGTGILKGPFPIKVKQRRIDRTPEGMALRLEISIDPATKRVDPWNLFPDPACGENIHSGQYVVERDYINARQLRDLKGLPGYLTDAIDKVIEEGPGKKNLTGGPRSMLDGASDKDLFECWYFYGMIDKEDLEVMDVELENKKLDAMPAIVTLINDTAIKADLNPLDSGEFPYDLMPWQRRAGMPWGIGVPKQISSPQRMLNGSARNMLDNAGLSGGPQIVLRKNIIQPADGKWHLAPRKLWFAREDADLRAVNDAILAINIPSMQAELMAIIQFAMKMAEDVTGLPALLQGMLGKAPDTVGGMQMLTNNANSVLRRIARTFDDCVTEPMIRRYYDWIMQYGPDQCKGDFQIDARGSSALVERDIAQQALLQMGALVTNPAFGISPRKWFEEATKAQKLDPKRIQYTEEEMAALAKQPPPEAPVVTVAKIRADAQLKEAQIDAQVDTMRVKRDIDRDTIYVQAETQRTQAEREARMLEMQMRRELAMLEYANKHQMSLEQLKTDLARDAMKLRVQKELAAAEHQASQVATPAVEPPGRAPNGQAFQR